MQRMDHGFTFGFQHLCADITDSSFLPEVHIPHILSHICLIISIRFYLPISCSDNTELLIGTELLQSSKGRSAVICSETTLDILNDTFDIPLLIPHHQGYNPS